MEEEYEGEPILLFNSTGCVIGFRGVKLFSVRRPPGERIWRNEGELAPVVKSSLDLEKMFAMDPEYLEPLKAIMNPDYFKARFTSLTAFRNAHSRRISRFMNHHLSKMLAYGLGHDTKHSDFTMTVFTTPKKDKRLRTVLDCRPLNEIFARPPPMDLDRLPDLIDEILTHKYVALADAKSYFYQFRLHREVQSYFVSKMSGGRGVFSYF